MDINESEQEKQALLVRAQEVASVLAHYAEEVDKQAVFPHESIKALKASHFMSLLIPRRYGGQGASYQTMIEVAQIFAGACLSTGMIWAMHCQQVAVLVDHAAPLLCETLLRRIAADELLIASVTSERGKGGYLFSANAPLLWEDDEVVLVRNAPVVTGGAFADAYLITMRSSEEAAPSSVSLIFALREQLETTVSSGWEALGLRGTQSVGMDLQGRLPSMQVVTGVTDWHAIAVRTLIPVGHLAWAAAWLGAATQALHQFLQILRNPQTRKQFNCDSDLFAERLARVRLQLDLVSAYLKQVTLEYEMLRRDAGDDWQRFDAVPYHIHLNNLKILASETLFEAINRLMQIAGLQYGYLKNPLISLERTFRDLRSASLMYINDRLLIANGKLTLLDRNVTLI